MDTICDRTLGILIRLILFDLTALVLISIENPITIYIGYILVLVFILRIISGKPLVSYISSLKLKYCISVGIIALGNLMISYLIMLSFVNFTTYNLQYDYSDKFYFPLLVVILGPIYEELVYRGILINILRKFMNINLVIILTSLLFGVGHQNITQTTYAFVGGLVFGLIYVYTDNLIYSILAHSINNLLGGFLFKLFKPNLVIISLFVIVSILSLYYLRNDNYKRPKH